MLSAEAYEVAARPRPCRLSVWRSSADLTGRLRRQPLLFQRLRESKPRPAATPPVERSPQRRERQPSHPPCTYRRQHGAPSGRRRGSHTQNTSIARSHGLATSPLLPATCATDKLPAARARGRSSLAGCLGRAADLRERGSRFSRSPYEMAAYFPGFTVGLTPAAAAVRPQLLNFTVGYDGRHASYSSISSHFPQG